GPESAGSLPPPRQSLSRRVGGEGLRRCNRNTRRGVGRSTRRCCRRPHPPDSLRRRGGEASRAEDQRSARSIATSGTKRSTLHTHKGPSSRSASAQRATEHLGSQKWSG